MLYPPNGPLQVYPGGRLNEDDDDYEKALKREVKEEMNIDINIIDPIDVQMWSINGSNHRYGVFFLCKPLSDAKEIKLSEEHVKVKWFDYGELMKHYSEFPERAKPGIRIADKLHRRGFL